MENKNTPFQSIGYLYADPLEESFGIGRPWVPSLWVGFLWFMLFGNNGLCIWLLGQPWFLLTLPNVRTENSWGQLIYYHGVSIKKARRLVCGSILSILMTTGYSSLIPWWVLAPGTIFLLVGSIRYMCIYVLSGHRMVEKFHLLRETNSHNEWVLTRSKFQCHPQVDLVRFLLRDLPEQLSPKQEPRPTTA